MEKVEKDYREFLQLFNQHKVKYCIVGAFAVAYYAIPRYTKDMDIFVEPSTRNGRKIVHALEEFGFEALELSAEDFAKEGKIIQLGYEPIRIDLLTAIDGVTFEEVWRTDEPDLELASESEVAQLFPDCETGAMPPFGNLFGLSVWVDDSLGREAETVFNAGNHRQTVHMAFSDFARLVKPSFGALGRPLEG